jgi:hypothetical protein
VGPPCRLAAVAEGQRGQRGNQLARTRAITRRTVGTSISYPPHQGELSRLERRGTGEMKGIGGAASPGWLFQAASLTRSAAAAPTAAGSAMV